MEENWENISDDNWDKFEETSQEDLIESTPDLKLPENFESPQQATLERLKLLSSLILRVENPEFALDLLGAEELLQDLGSLLNNQVQSSLDLGISVTEDPFDRSDALGNVRMYHRKESISFDPQIFQDVAECLYDLAHQLSQHRQHLYSVAEKISIESPRWDDRALDQVLDARSEISFLKRKIGKLAARNKVLAGRLHRFQRKLTNRKSNHPLEIASDKKTKTSRVSDFMSEKKDSSICLTRNEKRKDSFLNFLDSMSSEW